MGFVNGRAKDDETKKQAIARILDVWKHNPELRLGQLIYGATRLSGVDIFNSGRLRTLVWRGRRPFSGDSSK